MKHQHNYQLLERGACRPIHTANRELWRRILGWQALPTTIRQSVCRPLGFHYPLYAWGDENGFGFWTMNKLGGGIAFQVGSPTSPPRALLIVQIGQEIRGDQCHWDHERPNLQNYRTLERKVTRTAFETMTQSGPKRREWIHGLINEIYPLPQS